VLYLLFKEHIFSIEKEVVVSSIHTLCHNCLHNIVLHHLKEMLRVAGRSVSMEKIYAANRIRKWWRGISDRRQERKDAVRTIEDFYQMVLAKRRIVQCVRTIERWWIKVLNTRRTRMYWLTIAVHIIERNVKTFLFKRELQRRIYRRTERQDIERRKRLDNMDRYQQQYKKSMASRAKQQKQYQQQALLPPPTYESVIQQALQNGEISSTQSDRSLALRSSNNSFTSDSSSIRIPEELRQYMESYQKDRFDFPNNSNANNSTISSSFLEELVKTSRGDRQLKQLEWRTQNSSNLPPVLNDYETSSIPFISESSSTISNFPSHNNSRMSPPSVKQPVYIPSPAVANVEVRMTAKPQPVKQTIPKQMSETQHIMATRIGSAAPRQAKSPDVTYSHRSSSPPTHISYSTISSVERSDESIIDHSRTESMNATYENLLNTLHNKGREPPTVKPTIKSHQVELENKGVSKVREPVTPVVEQQQQQQQQQPKKQKFTSSRNSSLFMRVYGEAASEKPLISPIGKSSPEVGPSRTQKVTIRPTVASPPVKPPPVRIQQKPKPQPPREDLQQERKQLKPAAAAPKVSQTRTPHKPSSLSRTLQPKIAGTGRKPVEPMHMTHSNKMITPSTNTALLKKKINRIEIFGEWEKQVDDFVHDYLAE
jgi:hypothetical protein